jgi:hypothetical protein
MACAGSRNGVFVRASEYHAYHLQLHAQAISQHRATGPDQIRQALEAVSGPITTLAEQSGLFMEWSLDVEGAVKRGLCRLMASDKDYILRYIAWMEMSTSDVMSYSMAPNLRTSRLGLFYSLVPLLSRAVYLRSGGHSLRYFSITIFQHFWPSHVL